MKSLEGRDFPLLSDARWGVIARRRYADRNGVPGPGYDANISKAVSLEAIADGTPTSWRSQCF